jgi:enoyl-CoA hydratase/carnithine racemase
VSDDAPIRWELHGDHVGIITLDRPDARNALTYGMYAELEALVRAATPSGVRCLVITGSDPAFCSGDDVRQVMGGGAEGAAPLAASPDRAFRLTPAADALLHTDIPVIAAVNGAAVGWGMELAMMADLRVASQRAKFGELFVLRGLVSDVAGLGRLASLVGREQAAHGPAPGRADCRQSAAGGAGIEVGSARRRRPRLATARGVGQRDAVAAFHHRGPSRGCALVPGEAPARVPRSLMTVSR